MKFVLVASPEGATPRQQERGWTYIAEGNPKVGDIVVGEFGYENEYMTVLETATKRSRLSTGYTGPLKTARPATADELQLLAARDKAWEAVRRAEERAMRIEESLTEAQARAEAA